MQLYKMDEEVPGEMILVYTISLVDTYDWEVYEYLVNEFIEILDQYKSVVELDSIQMWT